MRVLGWSNLLGLMVLVLSELAQAAEDPNRSAERLMREATSLSTRADEISNPAEAQYLYLVARANLQRIVEQYPASRVASRLVLGDPLTRHIEGGIARTSAGSGPCSLGFHVVEKRVPICNLALSDSGQLVHGAEVISEVVVSYIQFGAATEKTLAEKLILFPPSPSGRYTILQACDKDLCWALFVYDRDQRRLLQTHSGKYGPDRWISWSPGGDHAVLFNTNEGVNWLHIIDALTGDSMPYPSYQSRHSKLIDKRSLSWIGERHFQVRTANCRSQYCEGTSIDSDGTIEEVRF